MPTPQKPAHAGSAPASEPVSGGATAAARSFGGRSRRPGKKVLPEHGRGHNRSLVLQTLFHRGPLSRADLARETGLTRVTISDLVAELIVDGFVIEQGLREGSRPGKPAILLDIDRAAHRIVGIDLSGPTAFLGAVLTLDGEIVARHEVPRPSGGEAAASAVIDLARHLIADSHAPVLGVGVGTPGIVDDRGVVLSAPNLGWSAFDLESHLRTALGLPVLVANDANAAALAEYTFGGAEEDMMLIKVGAGVGSGLLTGGRPTRGSRFAAGEIGHVTIGTDGGPRCACGKVGCLEAWLSVPALEARLAEASAHDGDGGTREDARGVGATGSLPDRESVLRDAGERLGIAVAPIVGALDLSEIVLSGPPELLDGPLLQQAADTLRARTLAEFHDGVRVRMTQHGQDIVLRGAAVMVLSGQLGVS